MHFPKSGICRCSSVNLRTADCTAMQTCIKSWVCQDLLQKPSELVMHRSKTDGGLGVIMVHLMSKAYLIRSFMETAAHPGFLHHLLHEALFRYHVQGETSIPNPGFSIYYDQSFFDTIKHYYMESPMNITILSTKQWYNLLLNDEVLMSPANEYSPATLRPARCELENPNSDWNLTWHLLTI